MKNKTIYLSILLGFSTTVFAQTYNGSVGINTATPDASAALDIVSTNKGFLAPRIPLESSTDVLTIPSPATGLLVYNTGVAGLKYVGYVFWDGSQWKTFNGGSLQAGTIGGLLCNAAALSPANYTALTPYNGTLNIPYTGGNSGVYPAMTIGPVNGLTATLPAGNFNSGGGNLIFTVVGTPTASSPSTTTFGITIGGQTCSATVGSAAIGVGATEYWGGEMIASTQNVLASGTLAVPTIENTLRLDMWFNDNSNSNSGVSMTPRIYNITGAPVKIWWAGVTTVSNGRANSNVILAPNAFQDLDNGVYLGTGANTILPTTTSNPAYDANSQEVVTIDLFFNDKWYKIFYTAYVDNKNTASTADNVRKLYITYQRMF
jgi:hypothetical protein